MELKYEKKDYFKIEEKDKEIYVQKMAAGLHT